MINELVNNTRQLTAVFAALSDPTRRRILSRLSSARASPVAALARPFRISKPAISRHLRVLEGARLITRRREGRVHLISAKPGALNEVREWIAQCAIAWDASFDKLEELLRKEQERDL